VAAAVTTLVLAAQALRDKGLKVVLVVITGVLVLAAVALVALVRMCT
jgi:hypothetical protein